jgi:hypothetical protein
VGEDKSAKNALLPEVKIHGNFIVPELSFFPVDVNFTYKY